MDCPHCQSAKTTKLKRKTDLGYDVFRCRGCGCTFNERTGTPFNYLEVPTDIVFQVLLYRVRYKLSYRDGAELILLRGWYCQVNGGTQNSGRKSGVQQYGCAIFRHEVERAG